MEPEHDQRDGRDRRPIGGRRCDFGFPETTHDRPDGDGIWTLTLEVASGYTGYYTFTNGACGDWSCKENIAGQDCANPVNYNDRHLENITEDTVINTCFGQCSTDGSCNAPNPCDEGCFGCTEPNSCNYDIDATINDGSCVWNQNIDSGFRYIHNVFDDVVISQDIAYGTNISIISTTLGMPPAPENLLLDIYEPAYDTLEERPLLLYFHTGNFLPKYENGSAVGKKNDSCAVAICTEFAKKGYVVASCDYRLGWTPQQGPSQSVHPVLFKPFIEGYKTAEPRSDSSGNHKMKTVTLIVLMAIKLG